MSRKTDKIRRTSCEILSALKNNNINALAGTLEASQIHQKCILNRNLKYMTSGDQQRRFSVLLAAIDLSSTEIVKLLISKGADVNKKGYSVHRRTSPKNVYVPLNLACRSERTDLIPILVEAGADLNCAAGEQLVREEEGGSMYMEGVHPLLTFCLLYSPPPVYMALLNAGADPCASLCSIAIFGYQVLGDRMRTLLQAGAFLAKSTVDEQMVEYLLDRPDDNGNNS